MDKKYKHNNIESKWYEHWEKNGYFTPKIDKKKKPFTIIMPPPNANGSLHIGHAMFITLEDVMIRFHRMLGAPSLWLPGADHAGILTQVVFEKKLEKEQGKTRYDLGREKFFEKCMEFTLHNKKTMEKQMKAIGASCDWTRNSFTLDPKFNTPIYSVFKNLYEDGLLYRAKRMINWCTRCSTALSDLEVIHKTQKSPLYYLKYGPFLLATVRPETKFGDTAVAVHPNDKRYQKWIGKDIELETLIGRAKMKVIADKMVDPEFGTGVVKITPAHDPVDFEIGERHKLEVRPVIGYDGKLNEKTGKYQGLSIHKARKKVVEDLKKMNLLEKIDPNYTHSIAICERCKTTIEPLVSLQWFIDMNQKVSIKDQGLKKKFKTEKASLGELGLFAVKKKLIKIIPKRFEKNYFIWMNSIRDWCISRQIWWGHQLPVWYCGKKPLSALQLAMNPKLKKEKGNGCGHIIVSTTTPKTCPKCKNNKLIRDPDNLDTWFSSGQWPYTTLGFHQENAKANPSTLPTKSGSLKKSAQNAKLSDFDYFYPTSVMETGYEILFFWVARMIMLGMYATGNIPFHTVYLHGLVRDAFGEKMSKSKGNVINPLHVVEKYGADSLRISLVFGTGSGSDVKLGEEKIKSMRNFGNKLWNIARFIKINMEFFEKNGVKITRFNPQKKRSKIGKEDKKILTQLGMLSRGVTKEIKNYNFAKASERLYKFIWHEFADKYVEYSKKNLKENNADTLAILIFVYTTCLKLLHPFMPFITEEINLQLNKNAPPLITTSWPEL